MSSKQRFWLAVAATASLLATSCGSSTNSAEAAAVAEETAEADPAPTPEPEPTAAPDPTSVPEPTAVPEPTQAPEPTPAPEPTAVPEPTPEPTPEPEVETYDAPGDLVLELPLSPGEPGEIVDAEELDIDGGEGYRFLHHSVSIEGDDIAVSGFVTWPEGPAPDGGWPLIAWAHGTTGLGDSCAPSHNAENDAIAGFLRSAGYATVATDYEGLGTPGIHPYIVGVSEGRGVLDSIRAAAALDAPVTDEVIIFGHSQGGHAAIFAGQLWPDYAPEIDLIGVIAGAPPSQVEALGDSLIGGDFQGYTVMTVAGLAASYSELELSDILTDLAIDELGVIETGCTGDIFAVYNELSYDDVAAVDEPFNLDDWGPRLAENDTNRFPVTVPLFILHGGEDEQIPVETSATLFEQLCAFEDQAPTYRRVYPGQSHAGVLSTGAAIPDLLQFIGGAFAGADPIDECTRS